MNEPLFTYEWYEDLIKYLEKHGYSFNSFHTAINNQAVILRHDVDWSPRKAVRLAEIEAKYDVSSTYFFLVSSPVYNIMNSKVREQILQITDLGHEIGLHFSTHQHFDSKPNGKDGNQPSDAALLTAISDERAILEASSNNSIDTVSFHNPPEWIFKKSFSEFVSTYEQRFFDDIVYLADSNQRWRGTSLFDDSLPERMQILTHPVLWGEQDGSSVDRLREERDYQSKRIHDYLERTDRRWEGTFGVPNE